MIGDSVIWGQYVNMQETLPYYLSQLFCTGSAKTLAEKLININRERGFANLGLDGIHPAAMCGLIRYYGRSISNKRVILHLNPLWMSSKKHDLSDTDEFRFNHPRLVPQFHPGIPSYKAKFSQRLGIAIGRNSFYSWVDHVRQNYYENMDIGNWTMQYPYINPFSVISFQIPLPDNVSHSNPISWMERGMTKQDFPWVSVNESFQWDSFKKAVKLLQARKNKVFVIIGPFNPYILTDKSLKRYNAMKKDMETQLRDEGISYASISDLPSQYYADASHPLKDGYAVIAKELLDSELFKKWVNDILLN